MNCLKMLFTVDLSELSFMIAPHVAKISNALNAELHILFVACNTTGERSYTARDSKHVNTDDEPLKGAQRELGRFIEHSFNKNRCKAHVSSGDPAEEILKYASREKVNIIIVGSKRVVAGQPLHGRMVKRVIRETKADVWTFTADGGPIKELR